MNIITPASSNALSTVTTSAFYGPGVWTAWILCLISAWYTILIRPTTRGLSGIVLSTLYTNLAAIDLFIQQFNHPDSMPPARLTPPVAVVLVGTYHLWLQLLGISLLPGMIYNELRCLVFHLGGGLLLGMTILVIKHQQTWMNSLFDFDPSLSAQQSIVQMNVAITSSVVVLLMILHTIFAKARRDYANIHILFVVFNITTTAVATGFLVSGVVWEVQHKRCFFGVPCASQNMGTWIQVFALICGVALFAYQVLQLSRGWLGLADAFLHRPEDAGRSYSPARWDEKGGSGI